MQTCTDHPWAPIHQAILRGDFAGLGEHVDSIDELGGCSSYSPLLLAIVTGQLEMCKWIWARQTRKYDRGVILDRAVYSRQIELIRWASTIDLPYENDLLLYNMWNGVTLDTASAVAQLGPACASVGLAHAASRGKRAIVEAILPHANLYEDHYTAFIRASNRYVEAMTMIPNGRVRVKLSLLLLHAVQVSSVHLCRRLFEDGARVERIPHYPDWEQHLWVATLNFGSDASYEIVKMLLERGQASPWLYDARGTRLLEALWSRVWHIGSGSRMRSYFIIEENRIRLVRLLQRSMEKWTPARHAIFPPDFRNRVKTLLMCMPGLMRDMRHLIIRELAVAESKISFEQFRNVDLVESLRLHKAPVPRKRRKTELIRNAVSTYRMEDSVVGWSDGLVVGKLDMYYLDNHIKQINLVTPWTSLGRAELIDSPFISRHHFMIRRSFWGTWQIRVCGKNGLIVNERRVFPDSGWIESTEFELVGLKFRISQ